MLLRIIALLLLSLSSVLMAHDGVSTPDPMTLPPQPWTGNSGNVVFYRQTPAVRNITINPVQKTLVLLVGGQSNWSNITPTTYVPTNGTVISQLNIFDGAFYPISAGVLGTGYDPTGGFGLGNIAARLADNLINSGNWNQVLLVDYAVNNTLVSDWGTGGQFNNRGPVAMLRMAAQGITPATTGVTFAFLWGQGENDTGAGTTQIAYTTSWNQMYSALTAAGFSGRTFVCEETWTAGTTSAAVQAAQVALPNGTTIFSAGNLDAFGAPDRQADNIHFNDTGAPLVGTAVYNSMHASGAPF